MSSLPPTPSQVSALLTEVKRLRVRDLGLICQSLGLAKTGVKAELQRRITEAINNSKADSIRFQAVRDKVHKFSQADSASKRDGFFSPAASASPGLSSQATSSMAQSFGFSHGYGGPGGSKALGGQHSSAPQFKPSPFYEIESILGHVHTCEVMAQHRNSVVINLKPSTMLGIQKCTPDSSYCVLLFSAEGTGPQDIKFPHACEIKVNKDDVKANVRGIKNKPGSTRPVDITPLLRLKPISYNNTVDFTYALTSKPFYVVLYLCRKQSPTQLAERVEQRARISKASVVSEISRKAHADPDIVATSTTLSLKCPLSGGRIKIPIRATSCKHNQCYDALSYLQLQEQAPLWVCPECSNPATFENLAVDEYVKDILLNTSSSVEAVTVEPTGQWRIQATNSDDSKPRNRTANSIDEDEDDLSVISDPRGFGGGSSIGLKSSVTSATPGLATPRDDASKSSTSSTTNKRPRAEVIDLTLDSDEEEEILRPAKRMNYGGLGGYGGTTSY